VERSLYQLDLRLKQQTTPQDTAAIIIEPVLGEGGYVPAPHAFLRGLREVCDKHGILLIVDEVQSGFGRTGKMFNIEYSGVRPDIMLCAKVYFRSGDQVMGLILYDPRVWPTDTLSV
jgi:4-aminobutyrate aminotransferase